MLRLRRPRSPALALRRAAAVALLVVAVLLAARPAHVPVRAGPEAASAPVVVASRDLAPGTRLSSSDLRIAGYPRELVPRGATTTVAGVRGRVLVAAARAGEPVTDVRLVGAGLTSLLAAGQVAAPVRPADLAVTALVHAGDRVDVLATPPDATTAELVTEQALVLAAPPRTSSGGEGTAGDGDASGLLLLAVDGTTAARLAAASASATLTVTLTAP